MHCIFKSNVNKWDAVLVWCRQILVVRSTGVWSVLHVSLVWLECYYPVNVISISATNGVIIKWPIGWTHNTETRHVPQIHLNRILQFDWFCKYSHSFMSTMCETDQTPVLRARSGYVRPWSHTIKYVKCIIAKIL